MGVGKLLVPKNSPLAGTVMWPHPLLPNFFERPLISSRAARGARKGFRQEGELGYSVRRSLYYFLSAWTQGRGHVGIGTSSAGHEIQLLSCEAYGPAFGVFFLVLERSFAMGEDSSIS